MKALLRAILRKLGFISAFFILIIAALILLSQLLSPVLNRYKPNFEQYVSKLVGMPITMQQVEVNWAGYMPEISFATVTFFSPENQKPLVQIARVSLDLAILQSFRQGTLQLGSLKVAGAKFQVYKNANNEFAIQGFPAFATANSAPYDNATKFKVFVAWVTQISHIVLENIGVEYISTPGNSKNYRLNTLNVINNDSAHYLKGTASLEQELATSITVVANWYGDATDISKVNAKLYFSISGLTLSQWQANFPSWQGLELKNGLVNADIWLTWADNKLQRLQTNLDAFDLRLLVESTKKERVINRLSGDFGYKLEADKEVFAGDDILIDLPNHLWPASSFYLSFLTNPNGERTFDILQLGYLDIKDSIAWLGDAKWPPLQAIITKLQPLKLAGELDDLTLKQTGQDRADPASWSLESNFKGLGLVATQNYPGFAQLAGHFVWNNNQGQINLFSRNCLFNVPTVFDNLIFLQELRGNILVTHGVQDDSWQLATNKIELNNIDLKASVQGGIRYSSTQPFYSDLQAEFVLFHAPHVTSYLPLKIFSANLDQWLKQAFLAGGANAGEAVLKGNLQDFPFTNNNGLFSISGDAVDVKLHYADDWPDIEHINAHLQFSGNSMQVQANNASVLGVEVNTITAGIAQLGKNSILEVNTKAMPVPASAGIAFIFASPLQKTIGKLFKNLNLDAAVDLTLGLTIPLDYPDKAQVRGLINFANANLVLAPWNLTVANVNGDVNFTENSVTANQLTGSLFAKPITFNLTTLKGKQNTIKVSFANNLDVNDIETWLNLPLSAYAKGTTSVVGNVTVALNAPVVIDLKSDLKGITINLPLEFTKAEDKTSQFILQMTLADNAPIKLHLNYANELSAALLLENVNNKLTLESANLMVGAGDANWPTLKGLTLSGEFKTLDMDALTKLANTKTQTNNLPKLPLVAMHLKVGTLALANQNFHQLVVEVKPNSNSWIADVKSPEISGKIEIPQPFDDRGELRLRLDHLILAGKETGKSGKLDFNLKDLPAISFVAERLTVAGLPLGQLELETHPERNGMDIPLIHLLAPNLDLQASASWISKGKQSTTSLRGSAESRSITNLVQDWHLQSQVFEAERGDVDFTLSWNDLPYAFSLTNLNGKAKITIGRGRIVDIGKENGAKMDLGRMLSIFSLQTLPRRLSLDFSDLFEKGYSFDYLKGDVTFVQGNALTRNLVFDGPVARIGINGKIGLAAKNYDFMLSITPHVASSIPVAATLLTGQPLVGLAAFAVGSLFGGEVSKATSYFYSVTGPWNNPSWSEVKSSSKSKPQR